MSNHPHFKCRHSKEHPNRELPELKQGLAELCRDPQLCCSLLWIWQANQCRPASYWMTDCRSRWTWKGPKTICCSCLLQLNHARGAAGRHLQWEHHFSNVYLVETSEMNTVFEFLPADTWASRPACCLAKLCPQTLSANPQPVTVVCTVTKDERLCCS